ncbi:hypothetical protein SDJN02_14492, partial [Cucurbita argyrosperma subsp. argyrosperma]
ISRWEFHTYGSCVGWLKLCDVYIWRQGRLWEKSPPVSLSWPHHFVSYEVMSEAPLDALIISRSLLHVIVIQSLSIMNSLSKLEMDLA